MIYNYDCFNTVLRFIQVRNNPKNDYIQDCRADFPPILWGNMENVYHEDQSGIGC